MEDNKNFCFIVYPVGYRRVSLSGENSEPKYANFLCFVVAVQTNKLMIR